MRQTQRSPPPPHPASYTLGSDRMFTTTHYQNFGRSIPHPADSSQVWNLLTSPPDHHHHQYQLQKDGITNYGSFHKSKSLSPIEYKYRMPSRTVPRPDNSAQMINSLKTINERTGRLQTPIETDMRSDAELRQSSPPQRQPKEYPEMTLQTSPSRPVRRNFSTNLIGSNPQKDSWVSPKRVGENPVLWDRKRDPIAVKGYVKSNLPTLVGVCGLETLNESLVNIPFESHKNIVSSSIHPTYLSKQQIQCADNERVHEILSTLRNQSSRPSLRFVSHGQGTAREIAREDFLLKREQKRKERLSFVDQTLYSPIKSERKQIIDSSNFVSGSS
jgi:hypothetical protein